MHIIPMRVLRPANPLVVSTSSLWLSYYTAALRRIHHLAMLLHNVFVTTTFELCCIHMAASSLNLANYKTYRARNASRCISQYEQLVYFYTLPQSKGLLVQGTQCCRASFKFTPHPEFTLERPKCPAGVRMNDYNDRHGGSGNLQPIYPHSSSSPCSPA